MSVVRANTYQDASGGSNAVFSGVASPPNSMGFRNRIINGNMAIDQRNAGASVTPSTSNTYTLDRWTTEFTQASKFSVQQNAGSVTPPTGFTNYLGITSTSAFSSAASDFFMLKQAIEGFNTADLSWGTASAQSITLSFWVRSSLTGTFGGALENSASNRCYVFSFSVSAANTWEYKTITIAGDTSGTWVTNNGTGINLRFDLGSGSNWKGTAGSWGTTRFFGVTGGQSIVGTNGATFYITGVQLEAGTNASAFEQIDYGRELMMCQRYYFRNTAGANNYQFGTGYTVTTTLYRSIIRFPVTMRAGPSALEQSGTAGDYKGYFANSATTCSAVPAFTSANQNGAITQFTVASGLTAGQAGEALATNTTAYLAWSAEL